MKKYNLCLHFTFYVLQNSLRKLMGTYKMENEPNPIGYK